MKFNEKIAEVLVERGIKPSKMSKDLEINQGQLSRFLKHNDQLSTRKLQLIFDYLKIELSTTKGG